MQRAPARGLVGSIGQVAWLAAPDNCAMALHISWGKAARLLGPRLWALRARLLVWAGVHSAMPHDRHPLEAAAFVGSFVPLFSAAPGLVAGCAGAAPPKVKNLT